MPDSSSSSTPKGGDLLVADPFMDDPHFLRAVILLCERHPEGSYGVMLNKPLGLKADEVLKSIKNFPAPVFYGGPVQTDMIYYLHTQGDLIKNSMQVLPGLYWGGDYEELVFCVKHELIQPKDICFYVGYAGWDEEQFQEEIDEGSWLWHEGDINYVLNQPKELWKKVMEDKGAHYTVIAQMPAPNFN